MKAPSMPHLLTSRRSKALLALTLTVSLATAAALAGSSRGARAAKVERELRVLEAELIDLSVVAANRDQFRRNLDVVRALGSDWPVGADPRLLARLQAKLPGAHVDAESDSGDVALVRVQAPGAPERIPEIVGTLQAARICVTAASAEHGRVKVVATLADSLRLLEKARARRPRTLREEGDPPAGFGLLGSGLRRSEARLVEVRAELRRLAGELGPVAGAQLAMREQNERRQVLDALGRAALRPLTADQLRGLVGAPSRFSSLRVAFGPDEALLEGALLPGVAASALAAVPGLAVVERAPGRWAVRAVPAATAQR